ncbi:hypothetical protein CKF46_30705, partial [Klebsiella pneumoniae]
SGNYVTLKFDNRKIPSSLMQKIEELLESELEKNKPHKKKPCNAGAFFIQLFYLLLIAGQSGPLQHRYTPFQFLIFNQ